MDNYEYWKKNSKIDRQTKGEKQENNIKEAGEQ